MSTYYSSDGGILRLHDSKFLGSSINIDTIKEDGTYGIVGNANPFGTGSAILDVRRYSDSSVLQIITVIGTPPLSYERCFTAGTWSGWYKKPQQSDVFDTGWVSATFLSGFSNYSGETPLQVRKVGKVAYLRGTITNTSLIPSNTSPYFATVPAEFTPSTYRHIEICQGSGTSKFITYIYPNGELRLDRYSADGATYTNCNAGAWLNIYATWLID